MRVDSLEARAQAAWLWLFFYAIFSFYHVMDLAIRSTNTAKMQQFHWYEYANIGLLRKYSNNPAARRR
ncbi:hypothetical protein J27TS7_07350 [Paenibacillus dendritiformis]|nr:hypothetical protein J27TS7_07350 [Paenibacillus dendritiformis]